MGDLLLFNRTEKEEGIKGKMAQFLVGVVLFLFLNYFIIRLFRMILI
jgi:hypothetical protein